MSLWTRGPRTSFPLAGRMVQAPNVPDQVRMSPPPNTRRHDITITCMSQYLCLSFHLRDASVLVQACQHSL